MDSKDLELYQEEQRQLYIDTNKKLDDLIELNKKLIDQYQPPLDEVKIAGEIEVANQPKTLSIDNLKDYTELLEGLQTALVKAIDDSKTEPVDTVTVKNIADAIPTEIEVNNIDDLIQAIEPVVEAIKQNEVVVNVPAIQFPRLAKDAIPVRLSDGKSFYKAQTTAIASGMQEVDPLVGYQPSDEDKSGDPVYYGFVRKDGSWYIMANNKTNGTYRYAWGTPRANGGGLYTDAWANRANLTYGYFFEAY